MLTAPATATAAVIITNPVRRDVVFRSTKDAFAPIECLMLLIAAACACPADAVAASSSSAAMFGLKT
jgi:hypothetical protein